MLQSEGALDDMCSLPGNATLPSSIPACAELPVNDGAVLIQTSPVPDIVKSSLAQLCPAVASSTIVEPEMLPAVSRGDCLIETPTRQANAEVEHVIDSSGSQESSASASAYIAVTPLRALIPVPKFTRHTNSRP